jgi:hypothetical protein
LSGFFVDAAPLLVQRLLAGVASAFMCSSRGACWRRGWGAAASAAAFCWGCITGARGGASAVGAAGAGRAGGRVAAAWLGLGVVGAGAGLCCGHGGAAVAGAGALAHLMDAAAGPGVQHHAAVWPDVSPRVFAWRDFSYSLAGYTLFGVGYIGYMTFVVALLREQGVGASAVTLFYALLGVAVVLSSRIWAGLLDRFKGGQALARLNAMLGVATVLPALTSAWPVVLASGLLFGGVFLSVVASTTALVRHNLPPRSLGGGHQRVHGRVCGRADRGADGGGLDRRRARWPGARAGVFGRSAVGGGRRWRGGNGPFEQQCCADLT